eukprot:775669-Pyramimonas_sp.AAC.1
MASPFLSLLINLNLKGVVLQTVVLVLPPITGRLRFSPPNRGFGPAPHYRAFTVYQNRAFSPPNARFWSSEPRRIVLQTAVLVLPPIGSPTCKL